MVWHPELYCKHIAYLIINREAFITHFDFRFSLILKQNIYILAKAFRNQCIKRVRLGVDKVKPKGWLKFKLLLID